MCGNLGALHGALLVTGSAGEPAQDLAADEWLAEELARRPGGAPLLRIWEARRSAVVLGAGGRRGQEVEPGVAEARGVPVLRRRSGGGTVLIGPGCLCYSIMIRLDTAPRLLNVAWSIATLQGLIATLVGAGLRVAEGDLVIGERKVGGCAQRRSAGVLLHHGTLLYEPPLGLMTALLCEPLRRPAYRRGRRHAEFVGALPLGREDIRRSLMATTAGRQALPTAAQLAPLLAARYANPVWIQRL